MSFNFIGDIFLKNKVDISGAGFESIILNLEAPFSSTGKPAHGKVNLFMEPDHFFSTFNPQNVAAVNLANNHIMDYGEESFLYTLEKLEKNGIRYFGAGTSEDNFRNILIIENKIALSGYCCKSSNGVYGNERNMGAAPFDTDRVLKDIQTTKGKLFTVISVHWGQEFFSFPKPSDVKKARELIDAGADMVIGHHPHKMQSFEIYKGKYIFYSLGNGIFHDSVVPSKYDGQKFNRQFSMKYRKSSRISLRVELDIDNKNVKPSFLYYDKQILKKYNNLFLSIKTRLLLDGITYKIYSYYRKKMLAFSFHLNKIAGKIS